MVFINKIFLLLNKQNFNLLFLMKSSVSKTEEYFKDKVGVIFEKLVIQLLSARPESVVFLFEISIRLSGVLIG